MAEGGNNSQCVQNQPRVSTINSHSSAKASLTHEELRAIEGGLLLLSGSSIDELVSQLNSISFNGPNFDDDPLGVRLSVELQSASTLFDQNPTCRFALIATSWSEFESARHWHSNLQQIHKNGVFSKHEDSVSDGLLCLLKPRLRTCIRVKAPNTLE